LKIIAFLGNPGDKYANTRHNAGWFAADAVEEKLGCRISQIKFHAFTKIVEIGGEPVLLMKPLTYMNESGLAVASAARFYKIEPQDIVVVFDDMDLPPGRMRIKRNGSSGGHNGLKSIISHLGTSEFPRVKIGIGKPPHPDYDVLDWVLGKPSAPDMTAIRAIATLVPDVVQTLISDGVDVAMNQFNGVDYAAVSIAHQDRPNG